MNLEETIMAGVKKLPVEKQKVVLQFVDALEESKDIDASDLALSADEQSSLWEEWIQTGPKGPIEDDTI